MSITLEKLSIILGYPKVRADRYIQLVMPDQLNPDGTLILSTDRNTEVTAILAKLVEVEALLTEARSSSMATELGTMKLNYPFHIAALKREASQLLVELSRVTGLQIFYDKYLDMYPADALTYRLFGIKVPAIGYICSQW